MKALVGVLLVLAAGLAGCNDKAGADASSGPQEEAAGGTLSGVVVDEAIRPVLGANVTVAEGVSRTTDENGEFRFDGLEPGVYVVRASKIGYADSVTQTVVSDETPLVKLVLVADVGTIPFAELMSLDGFIDCGTHTQNSHFAACGSANVASIIVCSQTGTCLGNLTGDRYIVFRALDQTPDFLTTETVWDSTQVLGNRLSVWLGSATREQLRLYPESPSVWNRSSGFSPLYVTMNGTQLAESGIGVDSFFLAQVFAGASETFPEPVRLGVVAQQRFTMFLATFHGYVPPVDWRFAQTGELPPPPT